MVGIYRIGGTGWSSWSHLILLQNLFGILILGNIIGSLGFNVDTGNPIYHHGNVGSMFGFSVAQHKDSNTSWIIVGAPEDDSRQSGVKRGGAVYRCSCLVNDKCDQIPFDQVGNNVVQNSQIDEKSHQWFGATVKSSGEDGIVLACAPRYTWFTSNRRRRDPVGTCYVAKDSFTEFVEYSPCRTTKWGYHRQGSCQVGLGADVDPAGRRIFIGAVGSWYWQGQMFMIDSRKAAPGGSRPPFYQFVPPGQLYSQSSTHRPDIKWTNEGPSWDDDSYLGYSVASGEFSGDQDADVAVGMPRGANLTGKVVIYSSELLNLHNITGEQIGAYFGYSLCVLDVDGDGLDDIVIGAPMYTDYQDTSMKIETGRVYVVYQNRRHKFKRWDSLDGTAHRGRFGLSLASLGDINRDGIDDFAVGAPYDGLYGGGAVYIFQGTQDGVKREFTQVIYGSTLKVSMNTFGFSLAGGKDLDGNGYPDLIVGAYESDAVALFRSRPVVRVRSKLTFTSGKQINLDEKKCTLRDGKTKVACFPLTLCMSYDGFGAENAIAFDIQYILDSKKAKDHRMFFLNDEGIHTMNSTIYLRKNVEHCANTQVYIRPQIRDKLTSLEAEIRYVMTETRQNPQLPPIIDLTASSTERDSVSIRKDCGSDNVCVPDLRLRVTQSDSAFIMGSTERIWIEVEVKNNGEDSFESMLFMHVPQGLSYVSAEPLDTRKDVPILCSPPSVSTNHTIRCDIGNPLPAFAKARFKVYFQTREGSDLKRNYEFYITTNSTNPEESHRTGDNTHVVQMPIKVETDLNLFGKPKPEPVVYNVSLYRSREKVNESSIGPEVEHVYEVKCRGPSSIEEAAVTILWPSFTLDGEHFLYLLEPPGIEGPATCEPINTVNPLGIKIHKHGGGRAHSKSTTTDITVEEGEGRRRNFTHSSEVTTDNGSYIHTYHNSTYETRRTSTVGGGSGRYGHGSSWTDETFQGGTTSISDGQGGRDRGTTITQTGTTNYDRNAARSGVDFVTEDTLRGHGSGSSTNDGNQFIYVPRYGERGYTGDERQTGTSGVERSYGHGGSRTVERTHGSGGTTIERTHGSGVTTVERTHGSGGTTVERTHGSGGTTVEQTYGHDSGGRGTTVERTYGQSGSGGRGTTTIERTYGQSGNEGTGTAVERNYGQSSGSGSRTVEGNGQHGAGSSGSGFTTVERTYTRGGDGETRTTTIERTSGHSSSGGTGVTTIERTHGHSGTSGGEVGYGQHGGSEATSGGGTYRGQTTSGVGGTYYGEVHNRRPSNGNYDESFRTDRTHQSPGGRQSGRNYSSSGSSWHESSITTSNGRVTGSSHAEGGTTNGRRYGQDGYDDQLLFDPNGSEENYLDGTGRRHRRSPDDDVVRCGNAKCTRIRCKIGPLSGDSGVTFILRGRVYADTLQKKFSGKSVELSSKLITRVTQLPYNVSPDFLQPKELSLVSTVEEEVDISLPTPIPWWIYLIAILAGVAFLCLLIYLLYKCGFFKRRRPNSGPEGQPLHRNGYRDDRM